MSHYNQKSKQKTQPTNEDHVLEKMSNETRLVFKHALFEMAEMTIQTVDKETENVPMPSKRYKIQMNRLFRERIGSSHLPFPTVDNRYERVRSRLRIRLKINDFFDRRKERRQKI